MRTTLAEVNWLRRENNDQFDRAPGLPLLGFLSGTLVSLVLWLLISWAALRLFV